MQIYSYTILVPGAEIVWSRGKEASFDTRKLFFAMRKLQRCFFDPDVATSKFQGK